LFSPVKQYFTKTAVAFHRSHAGLKVCRYTPLLRTGTSAKSLRQYRHFCQKKLTTEVQQCRIS